jgi:hypothetical protein
MPADLFAAFGVWPAYGIIVAVFPESGDETMESRKMRRVVLASIVNSNVVQGINKV